MGESKFPKEMFIAQLLLVNCPENLGEGFEELEFTLRSQWWLQLILHFFLGALQFAIIMQLTYMTMLNEVRHALGWISF